MVRFGRGWKRRAEDRKSVPASGAGWQPALDALREMLAHPDIRAAEATVVLSIYFTRHLVLPWDPALRTEREFTAYAHARFAQIYGAAAEDCEIRLSGSGAGAPRVAVAVERSLLEALHAAFAASALRLTSVQPRLMEIWNSSRAAIDGNAWISIAEPGRLLLGLIQGRRWVTLRIRPLRGEVVALGDTLDQESLLLGIENHHKKAFVHEEGGVRFDAQDVDMRPLRALTVPPNGALA